MAGPDFDTEIKQLQATMTTIGQVLDLDAMRREIDELGVQVAAPDLWDDQSNATRITGRLSDLQGQLDRFSELSTRIEDIGLMVELGREEGDEQTLVEAEAELAKVKKAVESLEVRTLLSGEYDAREALVTIRSGAGGVDAADFAEMLMRMYVRWAERKGFDVELLDRQEGEEAGIKSATLEIRGQYAYGFLKAERGVHRLVRISPFDSQARRHTSFASVFVYPEVDDTIEIEVREEDVEMDVYRASGAGGQHVNKTSSAVRLRHLPSGIVVACQQERSQHKNRATAMKMLKAALYQRALEEQEKEKQKLESTKTDIGWGSQIRSYVFQPYTMVNDHRTDLKVGDVHRVMDGDIDPFIRAYLRQFGGQQ